MDIETGVKIITSCVAIFGVGKALYETISGNKPKLREEYKFAREFLRDVEESEDLHPFAVEKGYQAIAGTTSIKSEEVAYILTLENSGRCLRDFVLARKYIEHLNTTGNLQIDFKDKYRKQWSRTWRKFIYVSVYAIFAFGAMSPFLLAKPLALQPKALFALAAFTIPVCGFIAWSSLQAFARIYRGEKLVENQRKHTRRILLTNQLDGKSA